MNFAIGMIITGIFITWLFLLANRGLRNIFRSIIGATKNTIDCMNGTIKDSFVKSYREARQKAEETTTSPDQHEEHKHVDLYKTVSLTIGKCQCCGVTYLGTTADKHEPPLRELMFANVRRVICDSCYNKMKSVFVEMNESTEVQKSEFIDHIRDMMNK